MADIKIDAAAFGERAAKLVKLVQSSNVDAITLVCGKDDDENPYRKTWAAVHWLLGYVFANTAIVVTKGEVFVLASGQKAELVRKLGDKVPSTEFPLTVINREKGAPAEAEKGNFERLITAMKGSKEAADTKYATFKKDVQEGPFTDAWTAALKAAGLTQEDATSGVSELMAIKSDDELERLRKAAAGSAAVFESGLKSQVLDIMDKEKPAPHSKISDKVEAKMFEICKAKIEAGEDDIESCYAPIVQSGNYDLKPSAQSDDEMIIVPKDVAQWSVVIGSVGVRYLDYCSNVTRTLLFNASQDQMEAYKVLVAAMDVGGKALKPGAKLSKVYAKIFAHIKGANASLAKHLTKTCGWALGFEYRESLYLINEKNEREVEAGQVYNLTIGFTDLPAGKKSYALQIADCVEVKGEGDAVVLTEKAPKKFSKVSWSIGQEAEDSKVKTEMTEEQAAKLFKERELRKQQESKVQQDRAKVAEKQRELARKQAEARAKAGGVVAKAAPTLAELKPENTKAYESTDQFPSAVVPRKLLVDFEAEAIICPVNGVPCPFHVSTIKNVTKNEQGAFGVVLRINFITPLNPNPGTVWEPASLKQPFLRELCYRSLDTRALTEMHRNINELKKRYTARITEAKNKASIVRQEDIILNRSGRAPMLNALKCFPNPFPRQRKAVGDLTAHLNGFRFTSKNKGETGKIDVLYANIKRAFFQPATKTSTWIILHFNLRQPIMVGKTKTNDVQFWVEYMEEAESTEGRRVRLGDVDEIEDEARLKDIKYRLEVDFKNFCERSEELMLPKGCSEFEVGYPDLAFDGTPFNQMVELMPTNHCLVHLQNKPIFIQELSEIEICYFERVGLSSGLTSKYFDMVVVTTDVFGNLEIPPSKCFKRITQIEIDKLDEIKQFLTQSEIRFFEGPSSIIWSDVLRDVRKSGAEHFYEDGGWDTLEQPESDEEGEDEESEDSAFTMESGSSGSEEDSDESNFTEHTEDSWSGTNDEDLSSDAMDESDMEKWAKEQDRSKGQFDERPTNKRKDDYSDSESESSEEDRKHKHKKSKSSGGGSGGGGSSKMVNLPPPKKFGGSSKDKKPMRR